MSLKTFLKKEWQELLPSLILAFGVIFIVVLMLIFTNLVRGYEITNFRMSIGSDTYNNSEYGVQLLNSQASIGREKTVYLGVFDYYYDVVLIPSILKKVTNLDLILFLDEKHKRMFWVI